MSNREFTGTPDDDTLTFFSKEKAEEYIVMNKPCLSIVDLQKKFDIFTSYDNTMKIISLKKLVKSKL